MAPVLVPLLEGSLQLAFPALIFPGAQLDQYFGHNPENNNGFVDMYIYS
jgi:hypothetical protein